MSIVLKLPKYKPTFFERFKILFGMNLHMAFKFPNMTIEKGESLIIHSPNGMENSVAVVCNEAGDLTVLFAPPSIEKMKIVKTMNGIEATGDLRLKLDERIN